MSQLLKRAGLAKRPRLGQQQSKTKRSTATAAVDGGSSGRGDCSSSAGEEDEEVEGRGLGAVSDATGILAVDDQIAALERELEDGGDSSSSGSDDSSSSEGSEDDADGDRSDQDRKRRPLLKFASPLEAEKIEPLPSHLLPRPGCGMQKASSKKKKPKKTGGPKVEGKPDVAATPGPSRGLDSAVKELMANYEARSSERVPFYCRVCQFQGDRCVYMCPCGPFRIVLWSVRNLYCT